jgi:DksA/TraR C4-type zinc finger protein
MKNGTYGDCEICGAQIPIARLNALPYATTCIDCQRAAENNPSVPNDWSRVFDDDILAKSDDLPPARPIAPPHKASGKSASPKKQRRKPKAKQSRKTRSWKSAGQQQSGAKPRRSLTSKLSSLLSGVVKKLKTGRSSATIAKSAKKVAKAKPKTKTAKRKAK